MKLDTQTQIFLPEDVTRKSECDLCHKPMDSGFYAVLICAACAKEEKHVAVFRNQEGLIETKWVSEVHK